MPSSEEELAARLEALTVDLEIGMIDDEEFNKQKAELEAEFAPPQPPLNPEEFAAGLVDKPPAERAAALAALASAVDVAACLSAMPMPIRGPTLAAMSPEARGTALKAMQQNTTPAAAAPPKKPPPKPTFTKEDLESLNVDYECGLVPDEDYQARLREIKQGAPHLFLGDATIDGVHDACKTGNLAHLVALLDAGTPCEDDGVTRRSAVQRKQPVHRCCIEGHVDCLTVLVNHKASIAVQDDQGRGCLHWAVLCDKPSVVEALLQHKAPLGQRDRSQREPLHHACIYGQTDTARRLIAARAPLDGRDTGFKTPLLLAEDQGHSHIVQALLDGGAKDSRLTGTVLEAIASGNAAEFRRLVEEAAAPLDGRDEQGATCLHHACEAADLALVRLCLDKGADPLAVNEAGATAMHLACASGCVEAVELLVGKGSEVEARDRTGQAPLHYAARAGQTGTLDYLLQCGANLAQGDKAKEQPFHKAIAVGHGEMIRTLCELGCCEIAESNPGGAKAFDYARQVGQGGSYVAEWVVMPTAERFEIICDRWLPYLDRAVDRMYRELFWNVALCQAGKGSPIGQEGYYLMRLFQQVPSHVVKNIMLKNLSEKMGVLDLVGNLQGLYSLKEGAEVPLIPQPAQPVPNNNNGDDDEDDEPQPGGGFQGGFDAFNAFQPHQPQQDGGIFGNLVAPAHQPPG